MKRRRVLHVIPSLDQSGAEKQLVLAARHLPRDEFDLHVTAISRGGYYEELLKDAGVPVHLLGKRLKWDPWSLARLTRLIKELKPDIVHTWMFGGNSYGRVAARWAGVPHVVASERCVDQWKSGYHFTIDRLLMRWTDKVVVNAEAIRQFYARQGIAPDRVELIPNAIEPRPLATDEEAARIRESLDLKPGVPVIGFVGRLWPQKRVQDLIWAADILRMSGWDFTILIIGAGPRRTSLERFADQLEITPQVRFLGHRKDAESLLPAIDILALPSQFEGLPNVVLEAMMAAKPVVGTRIPGIDEVVVDRQTGILVPVRQPLELARGLRELLADPAQRIEMGQVGRERVLGEFSVEKMIAGYRRLYDELSPPEPR